MLIAVNAIDHPDLDDWVRERAEDEARQQGVTLGPYLGREGVLGTNLNPDLCCHVFGDPADLVPRRASN